jgi:hypothetical protein
VLTVANRQLVVIGGLRQRQDVGDFTGVPYLKDLKLVGRLFRSRNTEVRESELVVFIMPEIIPYADELTCRQQAATETIGCRLDQVPVAEGCPPGCRRLPDGAFADEPYDPNFGAPTIGQPMLEAPTPAKPVSSAGEDTSLPAPTANENPADGAGAAVSTPSRVRDLVGGGQLRRLPDVKPVGSSSSIGTVSVARIFKAPAANPRAPELPTDEQLRNAGLPAPAALHR